MSGARHGARRLLLQALYQQQLGGHSLEELLEQYCAAPEFGSVDGGFFKSLLNEIVGDTDDLDACIVQAADRPVAQIDPVERAILWIGMTELRSHPDIPATVIINEAVELAKEYGAEASFRYINAVLDSVVGQFRATT